MRILFSMRHPGVLRNFASTLEALAARNHQIHLVFGQVDAERDDRLLDDLIRAHPNITCDEVRRKTSWRLWLGVGRVARCSVDYFRYLTPEYDSIISLKERARAKVITPVRWFIERRGPAVDLLVVVSDCQTKWPDDPPPFPVITIRVGVGAPPSWGDRGANRVITIDEPSIDTAPVRRGKI